MNSLKHSILEQVALQDELCRTPQWLVGPARPESVQSSSGTKNILEDRAEMPHPCSLDSLRKGSPTKPGQRSPWETSGNKTHIWPPMWGKYFEKFPPVPEANPVPQLSIPKSHQQRAGLPGILTPPESRGRALRQCVLYLFPPRLSRTPGRHLSGSSLQFHSGLWVSSDQKSDRTCKMKRSENKEADTK